MSRPARSHRLTRLSLASLPLLGLLACGDDDETAGGSADASSDGSADTAVADDTSDGGADAPDTSEPQVDPDLLEPPGYQTNAPVEVFRDEAAVAAWRNTVEHRRTHGPFASIDGLLDVPGIGAVTLDGLRAHLRPIAPAEGR